MWPYWQILTKKSTIYREKWSYGKNERKKKNNEREKQKQKKIIS